MALQVMLVQHAEKERGSDDPGLTSVGVAQAQRVARLLAGVRVDAIFASPLRRARETAEPLALACGVAVTLEPRLVERMNWTAASGLSLDEFLVEWRRSTDDRNYLPKVGESSNAVAERMLDWLRELSDRYSHLIIAVSHGGATVDVLRSLIGDAELEHRAPGLIERGVPSGALTQLALDQRGTVTVGRIAAVDHLQGEHLDAVV